MNAVNWLDTYLKAGSSETSADQFELLAQSEVPRIRLRVAENPATPKGVLEDLSIDPSGDVRLAVGLNRTTPVDVVYRLAYDEDPTVRHGLAEDVHAPIGVLKILAQDDNPYVSCRARKTIARLNSIESNKLQNLFFGPSFKHERYA